MFHLISGEVVHQGRTLNEQLALAISSSPSTFVVGRSGRSSCGGSNRGSSARARENVGAGPMRAACRRPFAPAHIALFATPLPALPAAPASQPLAESERRLTPTFRATALPVETSPSVPPLVAHARHRRTGIAIGGALALATLGTCLHSIGTDRNSGSAAGASSMWAQSPPRRSFRRWRHLPKPCPMRHRAPRSPSRKARRPPPRKCLLPRDPLRERRLPAFLQHEPAIRHTWSTPRQVSADGNWNVYESYPPLAPHTDIDTRMHWPLGHAGICCSADQGGVRHRQRGRARP